MDDRDMTTTANADLRRLSEAHEFDVAEGYPDIRGWEVKTPAGQTLGKVDDLIVSVSEMRVRYVDVDVDRSLRGAVAGAAASHDAEDGHMLLPIGAVELDDEHDDVLVNSLTGDFASYPRYAGREITHGYESTLLDRLRTGGAATGAATGAAAAGAAAMATTPGSREFYDHEHYDDQRAYAKRRPARDADGDQTMTVSEEQLRVGKRQVQAGEVSVGKTVETRHVSEQVPLTHEEVTVERRPLSGADARDAQIGGSEEIRVPVMREEAVATKQAVVREEIIIRKQARAETKTVEADLRKERVEIDNTTLPHAHTEASHHG